jgi:hypothetical protein
VTQPKTMLKAIPSIQTRTDVMGATENSPIHPCEARHSGKTSATARQITNRTTSAAERPSQSNDVQGTIRRSLYVHRTLQLVVKKWVRFPTSPAIITGGARPINESPSP